jgi:DNA-binding GntR family transcriptional regulator
VKRPARKQAAAVRRHTAPVRDRSPESGSRVEHVIRSIADAIASGELAPGSRIVEREIARKLKLGRGPVREAIQILIGRRMLERAPRRAARVHQLTLKDILDIAELWSVIAPRAGRWAAERIHIRGNKERISRAAADVQEAMRGGDVRDFKRAILAFSQIVMDISDNTFLPAVRQALMLDYYAQAVAGIWVRRPEEYARRIAALVDAILSGPPERAEAEYSSFMAWIVTILSKEYDDRRSASAATS